MKKTILSLVLLLSLFVTAQAQRRSSGSSRNWAVGLRLGDPAGLNVRKYLGNNAIEVNLGSTGTFYGREANYTYRGYGGYRASGIALGVNYIGQKSISSVEGLEWYWGLGGQLSSRRFYYHYNDDFYKKYGYNYTYGYYENRVSLGANALVGLEWTIPSTPISLFTDLGLHLEIAPSPFWYYLPLGIGGRFNF
jgi:hypothetical protein